MTRPRSSAGEQDGALWGVGTQHVRHGTEPTLLAIADAVATGLNPSVDETLAAAGFDSLQLIQLAVAIERTFDVDVPADRVTGQTTLGEIARWIDGRGR